MKVIRIGPSYVRNAEDILQDMEDLIEEGVSENGVPVFCDFDMEDISTIVNYVRALEKKILAATEIPAATETTEVT